MRDRNHDAEADHNNIKQQTMTPSIHAQKRNIRAFSSSAAALNCLATMPMPNEAAVVGSLTRALTVVRLRDLACRKRHGCPKTSEMANGDWGRSCSPHGGNGSSATAEKRGTQRREHKQKKMRHAHFTVMPTP